MFRIAFCYPSQAAGLQVGNFTLPISSHNYFTRAKSTYVDKVSVKTTHKSKRENKNIPCNLCKRYPTQLNYCGRLWNEPQEEQRTPHSLSYGFIQQAGIAA